MKLERDSMGGNTLSKRKYGVFVDESGRKRQIVKGCPTSRVYWDGNMVGILKRNFAETPTRELAEIIGVSYINARRKARELGLKKDCVWLKKKRRENMFVAVMARKRLRRATGAR